MGGFLTTMATRLHPFPENERRAGKQASAFCFAEAINPMMWFECGVSMVFSRDGPKIIETPRATINALIGAASYAA
jgi:hypothetical protein